MSEAVSTTGTTSRVDNDVPPQLSDYLPSIKDIGAVIKVPSDVTLPVDILLLTVKNYEFIACYMQLKDPFKCWFDGLGYVFFGEMGEGEEEKLKVSLMRCYRGSTGPGSSLITVKNAVTVLRPKAVISVGTCSGLNPETTKLGDVVVSAKLATYSSKIVTSSGEQSTGMRSYVSRHFLDLIKFADHGWEAPLKDPEARVVKVHCDGEFLSGPELISAEWRRDELAKSYPLATAIEMEGEGIFTAAFDVQIEWLVVKGIADYADSTDSTSENWSPFASVMAASVVANILSDPVVFRGWSHFKDVSEEKETPYKRIKLEDSKTMFLEWCQDQLREFYNTMSQVKITPWDPENTVHINDIYIQLSWLRDDKKPWGMRKIKLKDYSDIFKGYEHHPFPRRILVYGRPGIGKSTFAQKISVDWASGRREVLRTFEVLLLFKLQDVCGVQDFCSMLETAEVLSAEDVTVFSNLDEYVCQNQEKVLLVFDGYDEYNGEKSSPVHQIWRGSQLRGCCVIITTRPVKEDELKPRSHVQFEINGFDSEEQVTQFARHFLSDQNDIRDLVKYVEKQDLWGMVQIPLLLLMVCLLWKEKDRQGLPTSRADLYLRFIQTLLDHMAAKHSDDAFSSIDDYKEELSKLGKLAFDALLEDCLHFKFNRLPDGDLLKKFIDVGYFQISKLSSVSPVKIVNFLHKSVEEFLAAWFVVQELTSRSKAETVTHLSRVETLEKLTKMVEVLKFACELSSEAASAVLCHLRHTGENEGLTEYNFTKTPSVDDLSDDQRSFVSITSDCFFCCPPSERKALFPLFLSSVNGVLLLNEEHVPIAAREHFLQPTSQTLPNYLFFNYGAEMDDDVLSIMRDLNTAVVTCLGEVKPVEKFTNLSVIDFLLRKEEQQTMFYLNCLRKHHEIALPELAANLTSSPVNLAQKTIEDKSSTSSLARTQNHCLSLLREISVEKPTSDEFVNLSKLLPFVSALRDITLINVKRSTSPQLIESIVCEIPFTDNLYSLTLERINLTAKCAAVIAGSLHQASNLHELDLSWNPLYSGVSEVAANLHHVPQLTELQLSDVHMGEKEILVLASSLQCVPHLKILDVSFNPLGRGILQLAEQLRQLPDLNVLMLGDTRMGGEEVSALSRALKNVPKLVRLDLGYNPLGRRLSGLIEHLGSTPDMKHLFFRGVKMTKKEAEDLCTAVRRGSKIIDLVTDYHIGAGSQLRLCTDAELKEDGTPITFADE